VRAVLQRVSSARVLVKDQEVGQISKGLLVFVGVAKGDDGPDIDYIANKILDLRVFEDDEGKMNLSVRAIDGELLVVSQFTLYGDCRRGRRPSFDQAAAPADAGEIYERLVAKLRASGVTVATGEFQAMMDVELVNDGPVTLLLESPGH
jgi:D-tyrosyl-tRNA(Tyr) deacylase